MLSILLAKKILSMFLMILAGFLLVKCKLIKSEDSKVISLVCLYIATPCMNLLAFQLDRTKEIIGNITLAIVAGCLVLTTLMILGYVLRKPLKLTPVEQLSMPYTNCGNLMMPLVSSLFGPEWIVYTLGYGFIQTILIWTHGKAVLSGERPKNFLKQFLNFNIFVITLGALFFVLEIRIPPLALESITYMGNMLGPMCMLVVGMIIAQVDMKALVTRPGIWKSMFLRLILGPVVAMVILWILKKVSWSANTDTVLMIILMCSAAPNAANLPQMAQVFGGDAEYACEINILSTLMCIITMPIMIQIFGMLP